MSFSVIARDIYQQIVIYIQSLKEKNNYIVPTAVGSCVVLAIAGLCFLYYSHVKNKEYAAQMVLAECIEEYQRAQEGHADWSTVELMCKTGYEKFAATKTAVYFLPFRIDALLALDQKEAVVQLMKQVLERLGTSSPLYHIYKTKLALIKLDDANADVELAGLKELQDLVEDKNNINKDVALYYLMQYYTIHNQPEQAQAAFAQLEALQPVDRSGQSPWVALAQEQAGQSKANEQFRLPLIG